MAAAIRKLQKGSKPNQPVFDAELLPKGSIIAMDLSTFLVPFVKSQEGAAQTTAVPVQSCTSVQDKLETIFLRKIKPRGWRLLLVVDANFGFKDEVVRAARNKVKEKAQQDLIGIRAVRDMQPDLVRKLRRAEKRISSVSNDVVANAVVWAQKRPGITQVLGSPFEADAQVSHLVRIGLADAACTSDSDLYTFGCPMILYNHLRGGKKDGCMVRWRQTCSSSVNKLSVTEMVHATCLSGCDYIPRLRGMSLTKAISLTLSWREKVDHTCSHPPPPSHILSNAPPSTHTPDYRRHIGGLESNGERHVLAEECQPRCVQEHT